MFTKKRVIPVALPEELGGRHLALYGPSSTGAIQTNACRTMVRDALRDGTRVIIIDLIYQGLEWHKEREAGAEVLGTHAAVMAVAESLADGGRTLVIAENLDSALLHEPVAKNQSGAPSRYRHGAELHNLQRTEVATLLVEMLALPSVQMVTTMGRPGLLPVLEAGMQAVVVLDPKHGLASRPAPSLFIPAEIDEARLLLSRLDSSMRGLTVARVGNTMTIIRFSLTIESEVI